jgi:thiamine pyrophosphokinase
MEGEVRAIIVASGEAPGPRDWTRWVREEDLIIGADGGAARALARGLAPDVIIGDMDSFTGPQRDLPAVRAGREARLIQHPRAKDETDLELALAYAAEQKVEEIVVLGALGGSRLDHMLSNVLLLAMPALRGRRVLIVHGGQEAMLLRGGEAVTLAGSPGDLVSLLPLGGDARGVTTAGLAWPLAGDTLRFGQSRGVSNEMSDPEARVELEDGYLWVVHGATGDE